MKISASDLVLNNKNREILNITNFNIESGEIHILLGPNGAGKSSLMKSLLGFTKLSSGKIKINDILIQDISPIKRAQEIGYLAQNVKVEWNMNAYDLISLGRLPFGFAGLYSSNDDKIAIDEAIELLEISYLKDRNIKEMSGGELALCLLARVFAGTPKFIFIDEPLNHLDITHQIKLSNALRKFANSGGGVLAIIHDLNQALKIGDKFTLLKNGKILANGDAAKVFSNLNINEAFGINSKIIKFENENIISFS